MNPEDITKEWVQDRLQTRALTVEWAIVALYERQTQTEQEAHVTAYHNGVGFNAVDADIGTSFAKQIIRSRYPKGSRLSAKQMFYARKITMKYWKQLIQYMRNAIEEAQKVKEAQNVQS